MVAPVCPIVCGTTPPSLTAAIIGAQLFNPDGVVGQTIPNAASTTVDLPSVGFVLGDISVDGNEIVIQQSGLYELAFFGQWMPNGSAGLIALSLAAPPESTFPLAAAANEIIAAQVFPFTQDGTTFGQLEAGQRYSLIATQVSGETRQLTLAMLSIIKV
jgi:hypothetical protein